jgi:hypothetical protein
VLEAVLVPGGGGGGGGGGKKKKAGNMYGNKLNDIKPLIGALFEKELSQRWPAAASASTSTSTGARAG